jgi:hypothetical protein
MKKKMKVKKNEFLKSSNNNNKCRRELKINGITYICLTMFILYKLYDYVIHKSACLGNEFKYIYHTRIVKKFPSSIHYPFPSRNLGDVVAVIKCWPSGHHSNVVESLACVKDRCRNTNAVEIQMQ